MRRTAFRIFYIVLAITAITLTTYYVQIQNSKTPEPSFANVADFIETSQNEIATSSDLTVDGELRIIGDLILDVSELDEGISSGRVLAISELGKLVLVKDQVGESVQEIINQNYYTTTEVAFASDLIFEKNNLVGIGHEDPNAKLHINTAHSDTIGLRIEGVDSQSADLTKWTKSTGQDVVRITSDGKLVLDNNAGHQIEVRPSGDTGYLSSSGGSIFVENTNNIGTGIGIFSNAGGEALGNMINVKVDNPEYSQAAFYMNYDGISNAVEIVSNTNDTSSNALSITNYNRLDSALGVIGYETNRGTIKVTHNGSSSTTSASGLSIDLKGSGTAAQGIFVDSTESGGTTGDLIKLRNEGIQRFAVDYRGSVEIGGNGFNTSVTKYGNTAGDEFFVGTNGAFRVQRSATDSEAFRTQVLGDTQGRWLGTADGKLKFGDGSATQDVVLQRTAAGYFQMDTDIQIVSQSTNNDVLTLTASDGSRLGRFTETGGGHGWFEIDNSAGTAVVLLRADGGDSYINSGNFGLGTTSFDATANAVLTFGNGTAPAASITNGVQLWAEDVSASSELRVRDEAGNISTLSPHNFSLIENGPSEQLAWAFYSEKENLAINADITKALRLIEKLTGEKLVYIKNIETGEDISSNLDNLSSDEVVVDTLTNIVAESFVEDFSQRVTWGENIWKFITEVVFSAKARFESTVEFIADATFNRHINVMADTAGSITIDAGVEKFRVNFAYEYDNQPIVQVQSNTNIKYKVENISKLGFEVHLESKLSEQTQFNWISLGSNGEVGTVEIIE